jgi:type I restriction enzyme S subunit
MNIEGWTELCLAEILCSKNDKSKQVKSSEYQLIGLYPIVDQSSDFICGYCDDSKKVINNELPYTIFGDHTRHTKFVNFPFVVGADGTQIIKPIQSVDDRFFFYLVSDAANKIGNYGYDRHFKHLREFRCIFPIDKKEQEKIAEVLSTIDRVIAQTEAIIAKQQRIKTGLMQDLLTKGIDENGNIRSEATHQFKDSVIGRIPVEWNVEPCGSICKEIIVGIVIRPAQYYKPSGVPVLRSANVKENAIDFSDLVYMSEKDNDSLSKSRLFAEDLVTVRTGYPGTTAVIPPELDGCNCVDIVISRPDARQIRSKFLALWINSDFGKKQVLEGQGGLAQQHFNVGEVRKLLVKVPTIEEQSRIENFWFIQSNSLLKYQQHLRKLHRAKTGLMQDLLTGKVRVTNLLKEKEPTIL